MNESLLGSVLVVYIAFADFGDDPVAHFLRSYRENASGRGHRLLIACKNYGDKLPNFGALGAPADTVIVRVPSRGYDLGTYRHVAEHFPAPRYCFLNSRSVILASNWLARLEDALNDPGVGVAGATASYQSLLTDHLDIHRHAIDGSAFRRLLRRSAFNTVRHRLRFPPFPNPHLRTNAFVIEHDLMLRVWPRRFRTRLDTARFENGRRSLTRRIEQMGLRAVIVGRQGVYDQTDWPASNTFWNGGQANLLVADNQTNRFAAADEQERRSLAFSAWHGRGGVMRKSV